MDTQKLLSLAMLKTHFDFVNKGFLEEFVCRTMFRLAKSFWVLACKCWLYLFGFIFKYIFRLKADDSSLKNDYSFRVDHSQHEDQIASGSYMALECDGSAKKENLEMFFGFQFQDSEDCYTRIGETEDSVFLEASPTRNTSEYQVISGKAFSGFMEEPETMSFTIQDLFVASIDDPIETLVSPDKDSRELHLEEVQELLVGSNDCSIDNDKMIKPVLADEYFQEIISEAEAVFLEKAEDSVEISQGENVLEKPEQALSNENDLDVIQEMAGIEHNQLGKKTLSDEVGLLSENHFSPSESLPESSRSSEGASISNEIFSDSHVDEGLVPENPRTIDEKKLESVGKIENSEEISIHTTSIYSIDTAEDTDDEYIELDPNLQCSSHLDSFYTTDLGRVETKHEQENLHCTETEPVGSLGKSEEPSSQKSSWDLNYEDDDGFDIVLKHQDLIEQMKVEIKNARTRGLPTILEESETPKMVEDLKPLKIDEKLEHKDRMEEIQKVYKSYAERMRKLDILNYQTMHAISFLQLKCPAQQVSGQKSSVPAIKSFLFPNLWPCKLRRIYADPTLKSISEMHRNLELVYVGQVCLSWEILHWQYGKARELLEHDSEGQSPYNQVAGEFQQFQVLVQRFVENELFQGPRVQNYAKNRCNLGTLLQVPVISDDCLKDRTVEGENAVSIAMLTVIIDESMHVFWEFLRADHNDEANMILKGLQATTHVDLQDPSDSELLMDIKTSLQKKERRLKDILRSGNCIVKKFQKHHQESKMDRALLFARVELKLVSRVLNMPRLTTDQLVWCGKKLNKITFFNRKVHVEPSFLLFPF